MITSDSVEDECRAGDVADPAGAESDVLQGALSLFELGGSALPEGSGLPPEGVEHASFGVKHLFGLAFWASDGDKRDLTGPNPVDRGKYGSKFHLIAERSGLTVSVGISGANLHDSQAPIPLVKGITPIRSRRGRRRRKRGKLHADKGYDYAHLRRWLRERGITHRVARTLVCYRRLAK